MKHISAVLVSIEHLKQCFDPQAEDPAIVVWLGGMEAEVLSIREIQERSCFPHRVLVSALEFAGSPEYMESVRNGNWVRICGFIEDCWESGIATTKEPTFGRKHLYSDVCGRAL